MTILAIAAALVLAAGLAVLAYLLASDARRGVLRPFLALASLQVVLATWILGALAATFALEPWLLEHPDARVRDTAAIAVRTAATTALLWLPAGFVVAILFVRALHRGEADRLQLPLIALLLYGAALVWSAVRLMGA
jgi:hypothetical protein